MSFLLDPDDNNSQREPSDIEYSDEIDDGESTASLASSNQEHTIERVLAESKRWDWDVDSRKERFHSWVLIKWTNSSILRSSWEHISILDDHPTVLEEWKAEKKRQVEGISIPFDIGQHNLKLEELEVLERERRKLRRFRRHLKHTLSILEADY